VTVVVGQHVGDFSEPAFAALFLRLGDFEVELRLFGVEQALINRIAHEDVPENIAGGLGLAINQVLFLQSQQRGANIGRRLNYQRQQTRIEPAPDDCCRLKHRPVLGQQGVGAGRQQALHGHRQFAFPRDRGEIGLAGLDPQSALVDQEPQDLFAEQRIATSPLGNLLNQIVRQRFYAQPGLGERPDGIGSKGFEQQGQDLGFADPARRIGWPARQQDQQVGLHAILDQRIEQFLGSAIDPVRILDQHHDRACATRRIQQGQQ